ncbi:MAG: histidine kinase dimerization/phosphoacceptor domain -containing protein [bacterium]|nr:histidine kinase dimerization/phosphoacceptor domain -containing protein [bacterium]
MCPSNDCSAPVVEAAPACITPDLTLRSLRQRIRQQEILAELGVTALQGAGLDKLLAETARLTAEALRAEFCKVLEHIPSENRLLVRAGVGWDEGIVGKASIGADLASPAGFALRTGKPVISNHLENEERFRTPEILAQHGIHRAMNVILQGDGRPFGVLEVDSRSEDEFVEHDLAFLQGAANILGMAIERERHGRNLEAALERHHVLLQEMSHRVKNSLMIVTSVLQLQARDIGDPVLTAHLEEAAHRVSAVARAHDQLFQGSDIERIDLGRYIEGICKDFDDSVAHCIIRTEVQYEIEISADRAISAALIVNELIANAAKHAYRGKQGGTIRVTTAGAGDDKVSISVRDEGAGLAPGFDLERSKGLGMRIITSFVKQLNGTIEVRQHNPGSEFVVILPICLAHN